MSGIRFTAWLSERERVDLDRLAQEWGTSVNQMVRLAIQRLLADEQGQGEHLVHVTKKGDQ